LRFTGGVGGGDDYHDDYDENKSFLIKNRKSITPIPII
jgi:hypothetical protein